MGELCGQALTALVKALVKFGMFVKTYPVFPGRLLPLTIDNPFLGRYPIGKFGLILDGTPFVNTALAPMNLLQLLKSKGLFKDQDIPGLDAAQKAAPAKPVHLLLLENNFVKEEDLLPILAEQFGMELVDLTKVTVEPETLRSMPTKLVHRRGLMPLSRENGTLVVATGDPFDMYALDELQTLTGLVVQPVLASPREISRLIKTHFGVGGETVTA